jgi:hypothetical protein
LLKKNSAEVIEAISPEDLGKFSDNSIADALQRVPACRSIETRTGVPATMSRFVASVQNSSRPR